MFDYQRIISNNSYAHDEQGVNPGQVRGFDGVLYKLWPLLMPWLAASRCQPRWSKSRRRQMSPGWAVKKCQTGGHVLTWHKIGHSGDVNVGKEQMCMIWWSHCIYLRLLSTKRLLQDATVKLDVDNLPGDSCDRIPWCDVLAGESATVNCWPDVTRWDADFASFVSE